MRNDKMISMQGFVLRTFLQFRKAGMNWDAPIDKFRANLQMGDRFIKLPRGYVAKPDLIAGVPVEWIFPPNAASGSLILYIHGGGWTLGWSNIHRRMVMHLCQAAGCRALAVDYRLAPEHPFPAGLEDCLAVYRGLLENGFSSQDIVIAGDSAGANLTLSTLISFRDAGNPLPAAAVCISPMTDLAGTGETFRTNQDPALTTRFAVRVARYYAGDQDLQLPLLSPHYADLRGLPPLLIHIGEVEILLSDAMRLAENARRDAVDVTLVVWPKMWHVWHFFVPSLPEARKAVNAIGTFVREHLRSQPASVRSAPLNAAGGRVY